MQDTGDVSYRKLSLLKSLLFAAEPVNAGRRTTAEAASPSIAFETVVRTIKIFAVGQIYVPNTRVAWLSPGEPATPRNQRLESES
jgi:hypothetical protein